MIQEIRNALNAELKKTEQYLQFRVLHRKAEGLIWRLELDIENSTFGIDESLEGAACWWARNNQTGKADLLSVIPENQEINLRFATIEPPSNGEQIRIYPPQYLKVLSELWQRSEFAKRSFDWLSVVKHANKNTFTERLSLSPKNFPSLRSKQKAAFKLPGYNASFLLGPPGTGKTYTLGALLAQFLESFPDARILLLSTTNTAVDQALVSVDKALEDLQSRLSSSRKSKINALRNSCQRVGSRFIASYYTDRKHLLPAQDPQILEELAHLEAEQPERDDVEKYSKWKARKEELTKKLSKKTEKILSEAHLVALTTTRAIFDFYTLQEYTYDLIVFDESSQVSIPHVIALAPLSKHCLFAGDPNQLAPIVKSTHPSAVTWL